jgi:hypothetical protein
LKMMILRLSRDNVVSELNIRGLTILVKCVVDRVAQQHLMGQDA